MTAEVVESLTRLREFLWPGAAEQDDAFKLEIQRLSRRGIWMMALIYLCLFAILYPVLLVLPVYEVSMEVGVAGVLAGIAAVLGMLAFARSRWALRHGRWAGLLIIVLTTLASYHIDLGLGLDVNHAERFVLSDVTGALLVAVVVIPALPWQMFATGMLMAVFYPVFYSFSRWPVDAPNHDIFPLTLVIVLDAVLCAMLSAVNYNRLYSLHRSHHAVLSTQRELLLSESAASMGRLSAALSHELNSPLGSLKSSLATLNDLRAKTAIAPPERRAQLQGVAEQLQQNAGKALDRMERIVHHMQRFTNLDRADERDFDPAQVIEDVVSLVDPQTKERVEIRLDLDQLPRVYSHPQQVSAVLSSLLQNSVESSPPGGCVDINSKRVDSKIEIAITDRRPQLTSRELNSLFDPSFQVRGRRVGTGNWTWFNSRQILRELGGDLHVVSHHQTTTTTLRLPLSSR